LSRENADSEIAISDLVLMGCAVLVVIAARVLCGEILTGPFENWLQDRRLTSTSPLGRVRYTRVVLGAFVSLHHDAGNGSRRVAFEAGFQKFAPTIEAIGRLGQ
jgi:hypothetical protein